MSGWGWFILVGVPNLKFHVSSNLPRRQVIILLIPIAYFAFIFYRRFQAQKQGLPPPNFNPFNRGDRDGASRIYPAPSGIVGWAKNKYYALRGSRSQTGAYEQTSLGAGGRRGLDPDEAWDSRVGAEADGYGSGGYYEEQELGLRPPPPGRNDYAGGGYGNDGSLPSYGNEDMHRGRSLSRDDTAYVGGGQKGLDKRYDEETHHGTGERENPFGDAAEASSMRGVSPRPHVEDGGHKKQGSDGESLKVGDSPTERRSMFREENM